MRLERRVLAGLGLLAACAVGTRAQEPGAVAAVESATASGVSSATRDVVVVEAPSPSLLGDPVSEARRAAAEEVRRRRESGDPFQPSGVWLPPLYYTDAEHSIYWIGLLYLDLVDFEASTHSRLLAPFFLSLESPEDRTLITPLFGQRRDAEGVAGYAANYVWRRDRLADTDIVFPLFWSFRERDLEDGPDARAAGALAPLLFWRRRTSGEHWAVAPPLFWRWGDAQETTTIAGPAYWFEEPGRSRFGAAPFYFGGRDEDGSAFDAVPPLLFFREHERASESTTLFAVNTYYSSRPDASTLLSFPLLWRRTEPGESDTGVLPLWFGGERDEGRWRYDVIPPLLFAHVSDAARDTRSSFFLNTYVGSSPAGFTVASVPLLFAWGAGSQRYTLVPPALFARASDEAAGTSSTLLLNTYYGSRPDGHTLASFPLLFDGRTDGERYTVVPPLLFGHASDEEAGTSGTFLLNTYYGSRPDGHTLASFPLLFDGRTDDERYTVIPPLLFGHASDESEGTSSTFLLNTYHGSRPDGHTLASFPLLFDGRTGDERYTVLPPLLFGHATDESSGTSGTFLLNTYYESRPEGYSLVSFPFVFAGRERERETVFVPPALTYHGTDGVSSSTLIVNTYIELRPDGSSFAFAPLVFADVSPDESFFVGFPLLWHFSDAVSSTTVVAPFFHTHDPDGSWHAGFAPLWFSGRFADGSSYDLVPPLVWRFTGDDGTRLAVLPLFDYSRDATRTRVISPLMFHRSDADGVADASSQTVVLGLYWDFRGPELHTRVAFPLWWQHEDSATGRGLSTLFPLYWRRVGEEETTNVLLNAAWTERHDGSGWSFHLFPLFDLASDAPDHFHWQVLGGLLGHERRGARHRWRLGFAWTDPVTE